jgi:hypothetical protein
MLEFGGIPSLPKRTGVEYLDGIELDAMAGLVMI